MHTVRKCRNLYHLFSGWVGTHLMGRRLTPDIFTITIITTTPIIIFERELEDDTRLLHTSPFRRLPPLHRACCFGCELPEGAWSTVRFLFFNFSDNICDTITVASDFYLPHMPIRSLFASTLLITILNDDVLQEFDWHEFAHSM